MGLGKVTRGAGKVGAGVGGAGLRPDHCKGPRPGDQAFDIRRFG